MGQNSVVFAVAALSDCLKKVPHILSLERMVMSLCFVAVAAAAVNCCSKMVRRKLNLEKTKQSSRFVAVAAAAAAAVIFHLRMV